MLNIFTQKKRRKYLLVPVLILITPDSERTMVTFLGTAGKINENDIDTNAIKMSEILFLKVIFGIKVNLKKLLKKL